MKRMHTEEEIKQGALISLEEQGVEVSDGDIVAEGKISGGEIVELMEGYSFTKGSSANFTYDYKYAGVVKNGNKLTFAIAVGITRTASANDNYGLGTFTIPSAIGAKLFPITLGGIDNVLDNKIIPAAAAYDTYKNVPLLTLKTSGTTLLVSAYSSSSLTLNTKYFYRYEVTFLLSDNLAE